MSNTRHANEGGAFRQERFASSQAFERGLMANLVAKRCCVLDRAEDRELIWAIQLLSHQPGGLKKLAADLTARFPERLASDSMRTIGVKAGQSYSASQVKTIRAELALCCPLKGELDSDEEAALIIAPPSDLDSRLALLKLEADCYPSNYPAAYFTDRCREAADADLEKHLSALCLDPELPVADGAPRYFPTLISTLREFLAEWAAEHGAGVVTAIGKKIFTALDYATESRRLVIIDGLPRLGKSNAAKAWCNSHPGRARYVELDSSNGEMSFFRAIAKALGVSINLNSKAQELRQRVEDTLLSRDLTLVVDEASYLWPNLIDPRTLPARVNWILTALVNKGVAVALVTTPQFFRTQKEIEKRTRWTSEPFVGRIGHYEKLPDSLSADDLKAVASALLPGGQADSIKALVLYAQSSGKYLGGMDAIAARACFICQSDRRQRIQFNDVKRAILESVTPSDEALKAAIGSAERPARQRVSKVFAAPLQPRFTPTERAIQPRRTLRPVAPAARRETEFSNA